MAMSDMYGPSDESESIATIHAALDAGITMLDTGDFYGMGHNEMLIRRAIEGRRKDVFLAVKFGAMRGPDGSFNGYDLRPEAVKNFLSYSLRRLGTDYIDLYQPSRVDARTPIEDTYGALAGLVQAGYIRHIGISEASAASIRRASKAAPIVALQIEYSLVSRGAEATILPAARELGMGITAYGVLSRGLLSGSPVTSPKDLRKHLPRFRGENYEKNQALVEHAERDRREQKRDRFAGRDRMGDVSRRGHYPAHRRAPSHAAGRIAQGARSQIDARRPGPNRTRRPRRRRRRHALRRRANALAGQRKAAQRRPLVA